MQKQQENIKSYLHKLGMEQDFYSTSYSPKHVTSPNIHDASMFSFRELSDWGDRKQNSMQLASSLPKLRKQHQFTNRSNSVQLSSYSSSLLKDSINTRKAQSQFMNPVVIKFNTQISGNNSMRRSQLMFHRIFHNQIQKNKEDPSKLKDLLKKLRPLDTQEHDPKLLSPPKTERCSGILRMLKRRQQVRIFKRRQENPDALKAIKLQSK